jgi:HK97 family phage major capsid protein
VEDIQDLRDKRTHATMSALDIVNRADRENRLMTDAEAAEAKQLTDDADAIDARIEAIKKNQKTAQDIRDRANDQNKPDNRRSAPVQPTNEPKASNTQIIPMRRCGKLEAFTKGADPERDAFEAGMYICAELFPDHHQMKSKGKHWCKQNGTYDQIQNALSTGVPVSGGSLVPEAMSNAIIDLREKYGIGRAWADIMPMSTDSQIVPRRVGSPSASFIGENSSITESEPTFNNVTFTAKKLAILTRISTELSEDAIINIADYMTRDMAWAFALKEDQCIFTGDGTSTYGGITGLTQAIKQSAHSAGYIDVGTATHNTFQELDSTDLTTLMANLPQYARSGGKGCAWFVSQYGADLCFGRLMASAGGNTNQTLAMAGITQLGERGVVGSYLGYPIVASQVMPSTGTLTSLPMLAFGNLSLAATIADRRAITFATDPSRYFDTDQIAVRATSRVDIVLHDLGDTSTAGPIVVLKAGTS